MIDSHCHLDFDVYNDRRMTLLDDCARLGVTSIIIPGVSVAQSHELIRLKHEHQTGPCKLYTGAGLHPWWVDKTTQSLADTVAELEPLLNRSVAIGECGLDALIDLPIDEQLPWFEAQLQLACDFHKPLIIHVRKTHPQTLALLKRYRPPKGGVIHGFTGSLQQAQAYWRLGFYLGVGGSITYERAKKTRAALAGMPLTSLLLETDAPDMPLSGCQGVPNSPLQLPVITECLAQLRGEEVSVVIEQTTANSRRLFGL